MVESYYGPPIYDMSATDVTRKWLREAFREEIENYMKQEPGDTERQEDVSFVVETRQPADRHDVSSPHAAVARKAPR